MKFVITSKHRQKLAQATHTTGRIATVKQIALGIGGMSGSGIREPSAAATKLSSEIVRRAYTAAELVNDHCYEYALVLAENEYVGQAISEMALIDSDGDLICILNFLPKTKDDIKETYRIRNYYE